MIRWSKPSDREEIEALWQARFADPRPFADWFFRERFSSAHSAVTEEGGHVICSVQSWPCHMRIRDALVPCCIIAGVSTDVRFEGQGHMRRTMRFLMNGIGERGGTVVTYRPEIPEMYRGFGHFSASRTAYFRADPKIFGAEDTLSALDLSRDLSQMLLCYQRFSRRCSGIIDRSAADMRLKLADYAADEGYTVGLWDRDVLLGYCVCFDQENELHAEECITADPADYPRLLRGLCHIAAETGRSVSGKLPPEAVPDAEPDGFTAEIRSMNLIGVGDVRGLLRSIGRAQGFRIAVTDPVAAANRGVFDLDGSAADGAPQLRIEAGRLAQFLCGYRSLEELCAAGLAKAADPAAVRELDAAFPRQNCFIVDEY